MARFHAMLFVTIAALAGCVSQTASSETSLVFPAIESTGTQPKPLESAESTETTQITRPVEPIETRPPWLGQTPLATNSAGQVEPLPTPERLLNRAFVTRDSLPAPRGAEFAATISPFDAGLVGRSSYEPECPVKPEDLRYLTMTFWGFDGFHHTGEMVVHADVADEIVDVFAQLHQARFPIEEMRIATTEDIAKPPTGDANNTSAYECRRVTGGTRWSDHAFGTAIDLNPFHNPYVHREVVLPELSSAYVNRSTLQPGMIGEGDVAVTAFDSVGWGWGGRWRTLKDWQHFSVSGR